MKGGQKYVNSIFFGGGGERARGMQVVSPASPFTERKGL